MIRNPMSVGDFVRHIQMMSQELEAPPVVILGHWSVYMINATFNDLLNQYLATTNHNVENIV